jgi:hypothetical protein
MSALILEDEWKGFVNRYVKKFWSGVLYLNAGCCRVFLQTNRLFTKYFSFVPYFSFIETCGVMGLTVRLCITHRTVQHCGFLNDSSACEFTKNKRS